MSEKKPAGKAAAKKARSKSAKAKLPALDPSIRFAMEGFLSGLGRMGGGKRGAAERAQDIMYRAWEARDPVTRIALTREALETSADCADAYVLLGSEAADSIEEAIAFYREGVAAGERTLGKKAFTADVGYFWGLIETRPYMRARQGLAQA